MKYRTASIALSLATLGASALAAQLYHPGNAEEGVMLAPQHIAKGTPRTQIAQSVMAAQRDGSLHWISRGYPPSYPLVKGPALGDSRQQVLTALREWQSNPVAADGTRFVSGELGWTDARQVP